MAKIYNPFVEGDLELCDAKGNVQKTLHYMIDTDKSYKHIMAKRAALVAQSQAVISTGDGQALEKLDEIFRGLLLEVFGEKIVGELYEWYQGENAANMIWQVTPILMDEVFPALDVQRQQYMKLKKMASKYGSEQQTTDGD